MGNERQWLNVVIFVTAAMIILILVVHKHLVENKGQPQIAPVVLWHEDVVTHVWLDGRAISPETVIDWLKLLSRPQLPNGIETADNKAPEHVLEVRSEHHYVRYGISVNDNQLVIALPEKSLRYLFDTRQNKQLVPNWLRHQ
ncbi:MAG: hypothetical protein D6694_00215 [Gammaproteobacteria bacterium]|nr:MAG: hypothetical protein D6694_00215 [Gammaproteobacteria bacterium]